MKNLQILSLLASLLVGSLALAQSGNLPEAPRPQDTASTHSQPTPPASQSAMHDGEDQISQARAFPRFPRGAMMPPRGRAYPSAFRPGPPPLSPVGALIGLGVGGALGALSSGDQTPRGRLAGALIGGGLCALFGGAIGSAFSALSSHNERNWDDARRRKLEVVPTPGEPNVNASTAPIPVQSAEGSGEPNVRETDELAAATP
ncbi:MAG TPA: hypothetical protein VIW68_10305 [Candidatus Sulfotelmatobacter sp.]